MDSSKAHDLEVPISTGQNPLLAPKNDFLAQSRACLVWSGTFPKKASFHSQTTSTPILALYLAVLPVEHASVHHMHCSNPHVNPFWLEPPSLPEVPG
jgi:hypothetical protein